MIEDLRVWLEGFGLSPPQNVIAVRSLGVLGLIVLSIITHFITRRILLNVVARISKRTETDWDDILIQRKVFHRLSHLAPAIVFWITIPLVFEGAPRLISLAQRAVDIYVLLVGLIAVNGILNAANDIYLRYPVSQRVPIKSYLQVIQLVMSIAVGIFVISIAIEKEPWALLTGLGALTAILLLVFKDTILGFVAGIQLVANDMVRTGDWIEMPKYGADGDIAEITLNTVKVQNFDKTVTTIPTYALISDSFKNWRGMQESGGRRIKRSVFVDVSSICFCTPEMVEKFSKIERIKDYVQQKQAELAAFNREHHIDETVTVNGRRMTNIGTFRAYLVAYLRHHPKIHQEMTFLVRQLQPTDKGLPIEIYVFSDDSAWAKYEAIQADIFDHIFAAMSEFGLRPFQRPTGYDITRVAARLAAAGPPS
jgi:miniconductance mechanosensitive channel